MIVTPKSTKAFAKKEAGGKGYNLFLLTNQGLPVPSWIVIGRSLFDDFLNHASARTRIEVLLNELIAKKISAADASREIERIILSEPLSQKVESIFSQACGAMRGFDMISVRSSAADEDSVAHSFAGQLSSYLYVQGADQMKHYIRCCWASGYSERALVYRMENHLDNRMVAVSVVLQEMVDPDTSGVMFTCDPLDKTLENFVISSVYGVGEGLVSGALDADTFWFNVATKSVVKEDIVTKSEKFSRQSSGVCHKEAVKLEMQNQASATKNQLNELSQAGLQLNAYYKRPQDVEWAYRNGKLYLLQTRPVTTLDQNLIGYPNLWDNSNIVESYGGITLPLSFSFALRNYKNVYVQFCEILGVPHHVVREMEYYLGNMLGNIRGRVYYNLYNWYKLVGVLPGFKQNMQFMETMMGVQQQLSDEVNERISPHSSWNTTLGKWRKFRTGLAFAYYHFAIQGIVDRFLKDFHRIYDKYRKINYDGMGSDEIFKYFLETDTQMLGQWKAPIINDFLCMVHFGIFKKITNAWCQGLDPNIQNDLLAGDGHLESAEPTKTLIRMAGFAHAHPQLKTLIEDTPAANTLEVLRESPHQDFYKQVLNYLDRFGFRCMSEMKLEEIDLNQDPAFLFVCLKNYLRSGTVDLEKYEEREKLIRQKAEQEIKKHLSGFRKIIYLWSLYHARKAVRNRENTRFARTRAYGIARSMFNAMGEDLASRGIIEKPVDVFYLNMEEIFGIHQGTLTTTDLKKVVQLRKDEYATFEDNEPKVRFLTRGPVYWHNQLIQPEVEFVSDASGDFDLKGLPCCPGVVEGVVKVVNNPSDDLTLNGEILVTPRTDPGWVPLYPSVSGLLVERGSLLSHSAIVAREMGLPAIVSINGLTKRLKSGMIVRLDGKAGTIKIIKEL